MFSSSSAAADITLLGIAAVSRPTELFSCLISRPSSFLIAHPLGRACTHTYRHQPHLHHTSSLAHNGPAAAAAESLHLSQHQARKSGGGAAARAGGRLDGERVTPLIRASASGRTDIVAFLLRLPAVKASIDHVSRYQWTALSCASARGHQPIVQLLLDAGADPTIPAGPASPLNKATRKNRHAIAALLRHPIAMADRARALHKARSLLGARAAALACLRGRLERGEALPQAELITFERQQQALQHVQQALQPQLQQALQDLHEHQCLLHQQQLLQKRQGNGDGEQHKLPATAAFAAGVSGGEKDTGLCEDLYMKLLGYILPAWADKGPAGV